MEYTLTLIFFLRYSALVMRLLIWWETYITGVSVIQMFISSKSILLMPSYVLTIYICCGPCFLKTNNNLGARHLVSRISRSWFSQKKHTKKHLLIKVSQLLRCRIDSQVRSKRSALLMCLVPRYVLKEMSSHLDGALFGGLQSAADHGGSWLHLGPSCLTTMSPCGASPLGHHCSYIWGS